MREKAKEVSELLKVLANENRLLILCVLNNGELTVSEIGEKITSITQSALSQHLSLLKAHGILDSDKKGLNVVYHIKDKRVLGVIETLKNNYC